MLRRYQLERAIAACDGDAREAVKALIASAFLETELAKLRSAASPGAMRAETCCRVIGAIGMTKNHSIQKEKWPRIRGHWPYILSGIGCFIVW